MKLVQTKRVRPACSCFFLSSHGLRGFWRIARCEYLQKFIGALSADYILNALFRPLFLIWTASVESLPGETNFCLYRLYVGAHFLRAWIFILEGLLSVIVGAVSFWLIQDFPDTARFLSEAERKFVIRRLQNDGQFSAGGEEARWKYIWRSIIDWKTWVGSERSEN